MVNNKLEIYENLDLFSTNNSTFSQKVGNAHVFGSMILIGKRTESIRNRLNCLRTRQNFHNFEINTNKKRRREEEPLNFDDILVSVSNLNDNITIVRFIGDSMDDIYQLLSCILEPLLFVGIHPYEDRIHGGMEGKVNCLTRISSMRALKKFDEKILNTSI